MTETRRPKDCPVCRARMGRRRLLCWAVGAINAAIAAALAGPVLGFVAGPVLKRKERGTWVPVLADDALPEGATRSVTFTQDVRDGYMVSSRRSSVFLMRQNGEVVALDPACPHLGCHVEYKSTKRLFVCPCHGGVFSAEGRRVSGPPPRDMDRLAVKVEDGRIWLHRA